MCRSSQPSLPFVCPPPLWRVCDLHFFWPPRSSKTWPSTKSGSRKGIALERHCAMDFMMAMERVGALFGKITTMNAMRPFGDRHRWHHGLNHCLGAETLPAILPGRTSSDLKHSGSLRFAPLFLLNWLPALPTSAAVGRFDSSSLCNQLR